MPKQANQAAKDRKDEVETSQMSDAQKAVADAKKTAVQEAEAKKKAAQVRLKPVDPKEIDDLNRKIMEQEDLIDDHKDAIATIKSGTKDMRDKRKELLGALKAQRTKKVS